ncbi:LysE family transporter [Leifsonia sp. AG29]|uniref:LysE family transporter n=1 Tax=Leifsonia sp. AG29 TaxID=2598860 RepID=UPI00131B3E31|nr:LysE family transporter [Leifsonia sp. AG29]
MLNDIWISLVAGVAAGLGVAMPVGAVGTLILRTGVVDGFRVAASAAWGVATTDVLYCAISTTAGVALAHVVQEFRAPFLVCSGLVVVVVGFGQLLSNRRTRPLGTVDVKPGSSAATYVRFLALTAVNPLTVVYFVALSGAVTRPGASWLSAAVFVLAVGVTSLAWQLLLAAAGSLLGGIGGVRASRAIGAIASLLILAFGAAILFEGIAAAGTPSG